MPNPLERAAALQVGDAMTTDVTTVPQNANMQQVAELLQTSGLSTAPVVDEMGRVVGMISAKHFVSHEHGVTCEEGSPLLSNEARLIRDDFQNAIFIEVDPCDTVDRHMNRGVQTINRDASVEEAARIMCGAHIHHLIVLDSASRPIGVLSSLDLIAAIWDLTITK